MTASVSAIYALSRAPAGGGPAQRPLPRALRGPGPEAVACHIAATDP